MLYTAVCTLALFVLGAWRVRRTAQRRREAAAMFVVDRPGIELDQPYGGWDADAYDAGTGHDRTPVRRKSRFSGYV